MYTALRIASHIDYRLVLLCVGACVSVCVCVWYVVPVNCRLFCTLLASQWLVGIAAIVCCSNTCISHLY